MAALGLAAAVVLGAAGCQSGRSLSASPDDRGAARWGIVITAVQGRDHTARAARLAERLGRTTGMQPFRAVDEGGRSVVYFGNYAGPESSAAQEALSKLRRLAAQGRVPPDALMLSPIGPAASGDNPHDLRNVTDEEAVYTLQVAMFDPAHDGDFREAAEQLARQYRAQGHEAYFFHGPRQSLVTIGVFTHAAARVAQSGPNRGQTVYHRRIRRQYQSEFPHLRVNGEKAPLPGNPDAFTPTFLVRIPR